MSGGVEVTVGGMYPPLDGRKLPPQDGQKLPWTTKAIIAEHDAGAVYDRIMCMHRRFVGALYYDTIDQLLRKIVTRVYGYARDTMESVSSCSAGKPFEGILVHYFIASYQIAGKFVVDEDLLVPVVGMIRTFVGTKEETQVAKATKRKELDVLTFIDWRVYNMWCEVVVSQAVALGLEERQNVHELWELIVAENKRLEVFLEKKRKLGVMESNEPGLGELCPLCDERVYKEEEYERRRLAEVEDNKVDKFLDAEAAMANKRNKRSSGQMIHRFEWEWQVSRTVPQSATRVAQHGKPPVVPRANVARLGTD